MPAEAIERLEAALGEAAGAEVVLERPGDADARRLRDQRRDAARGRAQAAAARDRRGARRARGGAPRRRPGRDRRARASSTSGSRPRGIATRSPRSSPPETRYGGGSARGRRSRCRSRWSRRTRPARSPLPPRATAPTATRVARLLEFAGHDVEREYYYNDAGAQMDLFRASVEARRRGEEPPEDGYQGDYIAELATLPDDPVPQMLAPDRGDAGALPDPLRLLGEAERAREAAPRVPAAAGHVREGRRRLGALVGVRRRGRPRADPLRDAARRPTAPPTSSTSPTSSIGGFDRAIYVLGADHHGTRNWYAAVARMLGYDPDRVEVLLYQLVHLTRGGAAAKMSKRRGDVVFLDEFLDEVGVDAARWYLVSRGPDQTIEIDVDLAAEKSAEEPRLLRPVRARPDRRDPPQRRRRGALRGAARRARRRGARPDQAPGRVPGRRRRGDRAARPARDPDLRDPPRGRLPPLLPPPQGARLRGGGVPARPRHRDEVRDRALARLDRRRGTRHDVARCSRSRSSSASSRARSRSPPSSRGRSRTSAQRARRAREESRSQARNPSARMSYLIISTIVADRRRRSPIMNGIGLRRQGKTRRGDRLDPGLRARDRRRHRRLGRLPLLPFRRTPATCSSCASSARSSASAVTASRRSRRGRPRRRCRRRSRASASRWTTAPTRTLEGTISQRPAISEETQPVYAVVTLNYRVSDKAVQELFTDVGSTYFDKVVAPRVFQVFKNETVKFKSVAVAPNREQIRQACRLELDRAAPPASRSTSSTS